MSWPWVHVHEAPKAMAAYLDVSVQRLMRECPCTHHRQQREEPTGLTLLTFLCRPAQDGSALVNVKGHLVSPAAGNRPQPFTEVFILSQIQVGAAEPLKRA